MPYILSKKISSKDPGLWREGAPYSTRTVYDIHANDPKLPPVHYLAHTLQPHSLPHVDAPAHIIPDGATIDEYFSAEKSKCFYGRCVVIRFTGNGFRPSTVPDQWEWRITRDELIQAVMRVTGNTNPPEKILITSDHAPQAAMHGHDERYALVLSEDAAEWLVSNPGFNAYGTSWKSTDYMPGSRERPIHRILFRQALVFECLEMSTVPEGIYFWSAFPIPLEGASEAPVCPVLFHLDELK